MKKYIITVILFISSLNIFSQNNPIATIPDRLNISHVSNTGAPAVNIPLWNFNTSSLSVPVGLYYSTNGIKINELPDVVGLSWKFYTGGVVAQEVKGLNDIDEDFNFRQNNFPPGEFDINQVGNEYRDGEPDIFHFSFNGYSGSFIFPNNENEEIVVFPKSDIKVIYDNTSGIKGNFIIITPDGTKYTFSRLARRAYSSEEPVWEEIETWENIEVYEPEHISYSWYLKRIENPQNTDYITFTYSMSFLFSGEISHDETYYSFSYFAEWGDDNSTRGKHTNKLYEFNHLAHLYEISNKDGSYKIEFDRIFPPDNLYSSPYDSGDKDRLYSNMSVIYNNEVIKKYDFEYEYHNNRIFLSGINEINKDASDTLKYKFGYKTPELIPLYREDYRKADVFGYYGGEDYSLHEEFDEYSGYPVNYYGFYDECRIPNFEHASIGMLEEVQYPAGAKSEFEYELNKFYIYYEYPIWDNLYILSIYVDHFGADTSANHPGPGVRLKKTSITENGEVLSVSEYNYDNSDTSSGEIITTGTIGHGYTTSEDQIEPYETGGFNSSSEFYGACVLYENIKEYKGEKIFDPLLDEYVGKNGNIERQFKVSPVQRIAEDWDYTVMLTDDQYSGMILNETVFDNKNRKISETDFIYDTLVFVSINNISTVKYQPYYMAGSVIEGIGYTRYPVWVQFKKTINKIYNISDESDFKIDSTVNEYKSLTDNNFHPKVITSSATESIGDQKIIKYYYPKDFAGDDSIYDEMITRNILSPVLKKEVFNNSTQLSGARTLYRIENIGESSLIVPGQLQIWENGTYKTVTWFDKYDDKGRLLESHGIDSIHNAVLYAYNNTLPVASVINAYHKDIFYTSFEENTGDNIITGDAKTGNKSYNNAFYFDFPEYFGIFILSYWKKEADNWEYVEQELPYSQNGHTINDGQIDEVRVYPENAYISTITYKPLIGKTSETDANGISVYYEYDNFGRLIKIYDQDKNLIRETEYHINNNQ